MQLNDSESLDLIRKTVRFAHTAREKYLVETKSEINPLIAGVIGPYGAALHDGSEYSGSYAGKVSPEVMKEYHRQLIAACIEAGVDLLAIVTIPCLVRIFSLKIGDKTVNFSFYQRSRQKCLLTSSVTSILK